MTEVLKWFLQPQLRKKFMGQSKEIEKNCTGLKNFDICFCQLFLDPKFGNS